MLQAACQLPSTDGDCGLSLMSAPAAKMCHVQQQGVCALASLMVVTSLGLATMSVIASLQHLVHCYSLNCICRTANCQVGN